MSTPVLAVLALLAAVLIYSRVLVWRHRRGERLAARRARARERAEPYALGLIDGDLVLPRTQDARALSELLTDMAPRITGESRQAIAAYFLSTGELDAALGELRSRQWPRRARAAALLGDMCHDQAADPLIAALGDPHQAVRLAAARSLGRLGAKDAAAPVAEAHLRGAVPEAVARAVLADLGASALPVLRDLAAAGTPQRVVFGVELLGQIGSTEDTARLVPLLRHASADVRRHACRALGRLGDAEPAPSVAELLDDGDEAVRAAAAEALGAIGDRRHAAALVRLAQSGRHADGLAAASALAALAPDLAARVGAHAAASPAMRQAAEAMLERRA